MSEAGRNLPQLLGDARRWFDDALSTSMQAAGEEPVTIGQQAVFASLDPEGTTVSELARRIGVTRQTAHQAVHGLVGMGMLEQIPDPASARRRLIRMTAEGTRVHLRARAMITVVEDELADRLGRAPVEALRAALALPWGEPPVLRP